ncbi:ATP synthase F1, delta subunit [Treponema primitia ZAS-2]|uniref:ATP synthase subunit delta n=1 Tax=Treponema primitia (strain ATCC BAA-887 / DSM 12427 / ZAS-2) TaxID=545694 RepID=F5YRJ5_TREPZ|nr:ATP synthase F1 subunit delta [Treponema primitia]AEF84863.1 ATP synthase F1, delta subunit [Treponema primitia ZAS-2]
MFQGERWAEAYMGASAGHAGDGLEILKALVPVVSRLPGQVLGKEDGAQLERMLRKALEQSGADSAGAEYALRLVVLLVRKAYFKHLAELLRIIEQRLDAENGILTVNVESVYPLDDELQEKLKAGLKKKTGAREIKLVSQIVPELLGGYRLRIGTELIDTSLKGQIQRMAMNLHADMSEKGSRGGFRW